MAVKNSCRVSTDFWLSFPKRHRRILFTKDIITSVPCLQWSKLFTPVIPLASCANLIDWRVCSITPSSAATTRTTISVTCAPRDLIAEKAACPGVSRNVIISPDCSFTRKATIHISAKEIVRLCQIKKIYFANIFLECIVHSPENAPMCCVIPPNSFPTMLECRKASKRVVLPWSTCPMIVTTGGLLARTLSSGKGLKH